MKREVTEDDLRLPEFRGMALDELEIRADGKAVRKEKPKPPKRLVNIVRCRNPRCISSIEEECDQIFEMSSNGKYRCIYCEQELQVKPE